ncbi:MAG TPA: Asp-tRNA(Asn)/Glu-tRNA(Gln) amidotransferase subunit GatA [Anaerolineaceae bacterium]|nr:Asp-tRNA(Asn)/Glu-tRNA(Gln) amidotransferase subunit GatA [Anaerolineaceae bacterium]
MNSIQLSARQIAQKVRAGELSALEVLEDHLRQIQAVDGVPGSLQDLSLDPSEESKVHAFLEVSAQLAQKQAEQVQARVQRGEDPGPLAGVPVSIKDIFCVQGTTTTAASRILYNFRPPYTATTVERLQKAGALIIGKTNLDEFTYGSSSESSAFQPHPNNPWNTQRVTGGSSGGSAASVAAREVPLSLGTDTGGSIRQPAAFCGVVGLKPTYGRTSRYGLIAFGSSLDCPGPLARDVPDAALMLQVLAGTDPKDSTSALAPVPDYLAALQEGVRGLRIGLSRDYDHISYPDTLTGEMSVQAIQPEMNSAVRDVAEALARLGAEIVEDVPMPNARHGIPAYFVISRVEAASNLHRFDGVKYGYRTSAPVRGLSELYRATRAEGFGLQPKLRILMGMYVSAAQHSAQYYQKALRVRSMIRSDFEQAFDPRGAYRLDALLTPTTPTTAFRRSEVLGDSVLMQYSDQMTVAGNHAGIPAVSIPAGLDPLGLPIGVQFFGMDFREDLILRAAYAYEQATQNAKWRGVIPQALRGSEVSA